MSKYTPGPWKVDKIIKLRYDSDTGERLKDDVTVFIYPDNVKKENFNLAVVNSYCVTEYEANARLIAAAPEMYEALQQVKGLLPDIEGEGPLGTIENIIDHAIAKATGGQNE